MVVAKQWIQVIAARPITVHSTPNAQLGAPKRSRSSHSTIAEPIGERVGSDDDLMAVLRLIRYLEKKPPGAWMRGAAKILLVHDRRHGSGRRGSHPRLGSCARIDRLSPCVG